jgi:hypothetical protein
MNLQGHIFTSLNYYEQLAPLSIFPITNSVDDKSSAWSPFSTPSFSPYDYSRSNQTFQYSDLFLSPTSLNSTRSVPSPISRPTVDNPLFNHPLSPMAVTKRVHQENGDRMRFNSSQRVRASYEPSSNSKIMPRRSENIDLSDYIRQAALQHSMGGRVKICTFCKTNGETEQIYTSHSLKDSNDKITCPILMCYSCPVCGATGSQTHTKKYCPVLQKKLRMDLLNKQQKSSNK